MVQEQQDVDIASYTTRSWLNRQTFAPGTEGLRSRIADAVERRADEVVRAVLDAVESAADDDQSDRMLDSQAGYARQGTAFIVRWIRTGEVATQADFDVMGQVRRAAASVTGQITRMVRANLAFRDSLRRVLREEVSRLGGPLEMLLGLTNGLDAGFSQNLLQIGKLFDRRSQAYEEALADKEAELQHQALHDPLTGLANRALLFDRLDHACERLRRHPERGGVGVVFIDLDDFKLVNDRLGHSAGDAVLTEVARRLATTVRPEDTVARLGGDEFVVMCESVPGPAWAGNMTGRIREELATPVELDTAAFVPLASMGAAVAFPPDCEVERLLHEADAAMYEAKRTAKVERSSALPGGSGALLGS